MEISEVQDTDDHYLRFNDSAFRAKDLREKGEAEGNCRIVVMTECGQVEVVVRGMSEFEERVEEVLQGKKIGRKVELAIKIILLEEMKKMGVEIYSLQ